ncbi:MAG: PD40 domain-containing protein [Flavobacteriales bacterium]|nr:PD40 domain-containing protein [Flavobacteriales bacterium]
MRTLPFKLFGRSLLGMLALTCALLVQAQGDNASFNWNFEEGNKLMEEKFYNQAAEVWAKLLEQDPDNANLNYKLGLSYFNSYNQRAKALPHLKKASDLRKAGGYGSFNTSGYDPFDARERNCPVEVEYYLGRAYHLNNEFDKADEHYARFKGEVDGKHFLHDQATRGLEMTANARTLRATPLPYAVSNVGPVINGDHPDFSPVLSVDGNALFYTSRRIRPDSSNLNVLDAIAGLPFENIYVSYKDRDGVWQSPELLNINPAGAGHLATVNVSADGQILFIYRDDGGDGNLYESKLIGELWSDPVLMGSDINTKAWETHGALTADGNTFYFISDRKGGYGGRDIYRVVKLPGGEWSKAQNLGGMVNTKYDEDGVFIHPNGRTMYFSSMGHNSMGGFDIFMTELGEDGTWSKPKNLGYPLNTVDDDVFFITTADGRRGYFSSDQMGGFGEKDIYFVDLPTEMEAEGLTVLKGFIIPPPGEDLPPSTILYVTDKTTGEVKSYKPRQRDGVYVAILPPCREYNLDYRVNDKTVHTEDIFVECETAYQEINKEIYLNPVSLGGPASIVDLPKGSPPGGKEPGVLVTKPATKPDPKTDAQIKDTGVGHVTPDASYADEYSKYYAYNVKDIDQGEARWKQFMDIVAGLIEKNGQARVVIEGSASKVPTRTFGTNENLSRQRMEDARKRLVEAVSARGLDPNKLMLEAVNNLVQGPRYVGDYQDTEKYGKFQYVKLKVR